MEETHEPAEHTVSMRLHWPLRLCLFVAVVAVIYLLGTSLFSAARMEPLFYPFFRSTFHISTPVQLFYYLSIVRWSAHYLEYFVLLLLLVWLVGLRPFTALVLCLLLAFVDEGHQSARPDFQSIRSQT
ncbi:MAG TPA: VanZ family protein [Candidatus Binataceae bacterium]|jgi:VanZ family protein|nr:VanZ family protein [Candidatus Binataceae bacterium]